MKKFVSVLFAAFALSALSPAAFADTNDCILPICDMKASLDEFRALKQIKRSSELEQLIGDYQENTDPKTAQNLIDFGTQAIAIATTDQQTDVAAMGNKLLNQSNEQLATYSPLTAGVLMNSFKALIDQNSRYRVIMAWEKKIETTADAAQVATLRLFFMTATQISTDAKDEAYITREAAKCITYANNRLVAIGAPAPALELPIKDMNKALADFTAMQLAERFLILKGLTDRFAQSADSAILASIGEYTRRITDLLKDADGSQIIVVQQNAKLREQTILQLARNAQLDSANLLIWYRQLPTPQSRYAAITYWSALAAKSNDQAFLLKMISYFRGAQAASNELKDDAYVARAAQVNEDACQQSLIGLQSAPTLALPIIDMAKATADFTKMEMPQRFLLIKKLSDDYAGGGESAKLTSMLNFAKAIRDTLAKSGDTQAAILKMDDAIITRTIDQLARAADLSAADLATYFDQASGAPARMTLILYWGAAVDTATTKPALQRLIQFFMAARKVMNAKEDDESYVIREAQKNEQKARAKLAQLFPNG